MSADHMNPQITNTAARYVAKAMTRVHPRQRAELLEEIIRQAEEGLRTIGSSRVQTARAA